MQEENSLKKTPIHHNRAFLNKPYHHSDGSIFTEIELTQYSYRDNVCEMNMQCSIRDCNQTIRIQFDDPNLLENHLNNLYKMDVVIDNMLEFKKNYLKGYEMYQEEVKRLKEQEAKKKEDGKQGMAGK